MHDTNSTLVIYYKTQFLRPQRSSESLHIVEGTCV